MRQEPSSKPDYRLQRPRIGPFSAQWRMAAERTVERRGSVKDGSTNGGSGEFAEISSPHKLVMTRKFEKHPLQGARETTITNESPMEA